MTINALTQGLTIDIERSVGTTLIKFLNSTDYKSFTFISAFASQSGINGLSGYIEKAKETYESLNIIVGVNQGATSKEALEALLELGINTLIFNHSEQLIFHPKIYLFEGEQRSQLIVGSSNLTKQGLFQNIEASIHLEFDNEDETDRQAVINIKASFASLFDFSDPNLQPITTALIEQFVAEKIVPTEAERKEIQKNAKELTIQGGETIEKIIRTIFPKRQLPTAPKEFRSKRTGKAASSAGENDETTPEVAVPEPVPADDFKIVWRSRKLKHTHLQIPKTANTNPKGSFTLGQANFKIDGELIDQKVYFNEFVFRGLNWSVEKADPYQAIAIAQFEVIVIGDNWGTHNLVVRYQAKRIADQNNTPTTISWGEDLGPRVRDAAPLGRTLELYKLEGSEDVFRIKIV